MARPLRIEFDGAVYHVTSRGKERKAVFKDDRDRELFLTTLAQVDQRFHWICHAYCLMDNHYHLVIETADANLSKGMRQLNGVYTQAFNRLHRRVGNLFQGRQGHIAAEGEPFFRGLPLRGSQSGEGQADRSSAAMAVEQLSSPVWVKLRPSLFND